MDKKLYICHTPYQVFITLIKNYNDKAKIDIVICNTIENSDELISKLKKSQLFNKIYSYNEKQIAKNFNDQKIETKFFRGQEMVKLFEEQSTIPVLEYKNIYIYNDWTTFGAYLIDKKIPYHLIEDGIDSFYYLKENFRNQVTFINPNFSYKVKHLIKKIFHRGYDFFGQSKYVIDIEVNDLNKVPIKNSKMFEEPKSKLYNSINKKQKEEIYHIFTNETYQNQKNHKSCLILTQPLYKDNLVKSLATQIKIYETIINDYQKDYDIIVKPHPRDDFDYKKINSQITILDRYMPIEILNFQEDVSFDLAVTIKSSSIKSLKIVKEKKELEFSYLDKFK